MKYDLSILIPARNEMFLARTIEDILQNIEGNTEIIVGLDGQWADPPVKDDPRVTIIHHSESIGQRAMTNKLALLSSAKYLVKCDAHCAFDKGFDVKLMADMQDDWTVVPTMRNLWAFDWKCMKCNYKTYQGRTPVSCPKCDNTTDFHREMTWIGKPNPQSNSYCFDSEPHFQYNKEYTRRPEYLKMLNETGLTETMSLQGSFWMMTREKYLEFSVGREDLGSWGNEGVEIACKTWLSGGKCIVNHKTWYAHMFRTQGGDFGFPYTQHESDIQITKKKVWDLFFNGNFKQQKYPVSWLIEKFWPVPGWTQEQLNQLKQ